MFSKNLNICNKNKQNPQNNKSKNNSKTSNKKTTKDLVENILGCGREIL